jgi:GxxExxY protein
METSQLIEQVIGAAIEVHKELGPGLLESTYEECLCYELSRLNLAFKRQLDMPVQYKTIKLDCAYRLDLVIEGRLVLELKAVESLLPVHEAQLITYLKLSKIDHGLLINFNVPLLKEGIKRRYRNPV